MKTGIELITEERLEQIQKHGRTLEYDANYNDNGQLIEAASILLTPNLQHAELEYDPNCPFGWDDDIWEHIIEKSYKDRLIIAGALIAAEIDRLSYEL